VATSDAIEQVIILGSSMRLSARDFWNEVEYTKEQVREHIEGESTGLKSSKLGNTMASQIENLNLNQ
ncbi:MAG: NYN domain-containing protein, partial [Butyrivibrio sp.]|nr:NYN domain-containing protein [Butyrivibrio sp.]